MIRLGLCCIFRNEPIRFRTTTAQAVARMSRFDALGKIASLCRENALALRRALEYCASHGIGDFRVNSQVLPLRTHPDAGYRVRDLPGHAGIVASFRACGAFARDRGLRLSFHPDQFVLLSSPRPDVTRRSIAELAYQAEAATWVSADVINIHAGGVYGDKKSALARLGKALSRLPKRVRERLTLENDDRSYTPRDLLPFCRAEQIPLVYDVHHHRCLPDGLTVAEATRRAAATWNREPMFHVSSPKEGWQGPQPRRHHDFIDPDDLPAEWRDLDVTVEVEAKAKEEAVSRLARHLHVSGVSLWHGA